MSMTTHPRLVRRTTLATGGATLESHDPDAPVAWTREDTLFVVLLVAAIMFCGGIGLFAL